MQRFVSDQNSPTGSTLVFTRPVCLCIDGTWMWIENVEEATECLRSRFADQNGPSFVRASDTCASAVSGAVPPDAAQAAFIVAAMEAGFDFNILEENGIALERQIESAAANGPAELLFGQAAE